jgi:hypothetical protein
VKITDAINTLNLPITPSSDVRLCAVTCNVIYDVNGETPQRIRATWYGREATVEIPQGDEEYSLEKLIATAAADAVKTYDKGSPNRWYEYDYEAVTVAQLPQFDRYLAVIAALDKRRQGNPLEGLASIGKADNVCGFIVVECYAMEAPLYAAIAEGVAYACKPPSGMGLWGGMAFAAVEAAKRYYNQYPWAKQFVSLAIAPGEGQHAWVVVGIFGDEKEE